jgi:hypothetical protein
MRMERLLRLLTLASVVVFYSTLAAWAYRSGKAARLWMTAMLSILVISLLAITAAFMWAPDSSRPMAMYFTGLHALPVLTATIGVALGRGRTTAAMLGGAVGVVLGIVGTLALVSRLSGSV